MAIKRSVMKEKLEKSPLNKEELEAVAEAERYIDSEILKQYGDIYGVHIDLTIASFHYAPYRKMTYFFKEPRMIVMATELERRYKEAGWKIKYQFDDGLDGPNMSGPEYFILK